MNAALLLILTVSLVASIIEPGDMSKVKLIWRENPPHEGVANYRIFAENLTLGTRLDPIDAGQDTTLVLDLPTNGLWVFRATAEDSAGNESEPSAPYYLRVPPDRIPVRPVIDPADTLQVSRESTNVSLSIIQALADTTGQPIPDADFTLFDIEIRQGGEWSFFWLKNRGEPVTKRIGLVPGSWCDLRVRSVLSSGASSDWSDITTLVLQKSVVIDTLRIELHIPVFKMEDQI